MLEPQFNVEKKGSPSILKDDFSSRIDPTISCQMKRVGFSHIESNNIVNDIIRKVIDV